jgi:hypothetical protein
VSVEAISWALNLARSWPTRGGQPSSACKVDDAARDRAIDHVLKAADEVAAALQAHLIEEHSADLDRAVAQSPATDSLKLLRQARERLGEGLRAVEADRIAEGDQISLRNPSDPRPTAIPGLHGRLPTGIGEPGGLNLHHWPS